MAISARRILLASHGTEGARAAEAAAFTLCAAGGRIHHLIVVPDFWKGMLGDDWLNNAAVHIRFGRYVENELQREIMEHVARLEGEAKTHGIVYAHEHHVGRPTDCLIEVAKGGDYDLIIIGSPRPKGRPGYRSRVAVEAVVKAVRAPLLVIPHPER
jgi:nucleotide-binding universal stress UspA family protein